MINRSLQVIVFFVSLALLIPAYLLTPITYILFKYSLGEAVGVIFLNTTLEGWDYKTMFDCV